MSTTRTANEWVKRCPGLRIWDPDGWRQDNKPMDESITWDDFVNRCLWSTIQGTIPDLEPGGPGCA